MTEIMSRQRVQKRHNKPRQEHSEPVGKEAADRQTPVGRSRHVSRWLLPVLVLIVFVVLVALFSSSYLNRSIRGIGGGLGDLPTDPGLSSLLDSYLSPGTSRDVDSGDIETSGTVLMSYEPKTYVVRPGDTVSGIAASFDLEMSTIISFNAIKDVRRLMAGVEIQIPPVDGVMHTVAGNESLSSIAEHYGVDLAPILDINNIGSEIIYKGDKLFVPDAEMSYTAYHSALGDLFLWPHRGILSSNYGYRTDPFSGVRSFHRGYDIVGKTGAPVRASNRGTIDAVGSSPLYGNYVLIRHEGRYQTLYAHLSKIVVSRGQRVDQLQKVGEVGTTGRSTGPHLHFGIFYNGDAVDPGKYLN